MSNINSYKNFIIEWNASFPLDKKYREKYKIAFGSEEHRKISQIDVYLEWLEDEFYNDILQEALEIDRKEKQLKKGVWIESRERLSDKHSEELVDQFFKMDIGKFNNIKME